MSSRITALPPVKIQPLRGGPTLRWGVVSPGGIAQGWVRTVHANTDQRVVAVASRSLERAQQFAAEHGIDRAYGDYEQLLADAEVQIVYIASPHSEHVDLALLAIAAGKHVLVEKPIATSAAGARQIAEAARAAGVFAMEALWSRFLPQTSVLEQLLRDGVIGDPLVVNADFGWRFPVDASSRMYDPALGGGGLLDLGVYPVWFSHFVLGNPVAVTATGSLTFTGVDAQAALILDYDTGAQAVLTTNLLADTGQTATVSGTDGRIHFDRTFLSPTSFTLFQLDAEPLRFTDESGLVSSGGLAYEAVAVAQNVNDGLLESPLHTLDDSIEVLEIIDSARTQLGAA